jgi:alpha-L-fucosidase
VAEKGRAWEACMTMNDSWGYHAGDDDWKTPKTVVRNLITCARQGGNYLLNIGPKPDGSIPDASVQILTAVGKWMDRNGATIYGAERCQVRGGNYWGATRKGNTLYAHVYFWPGTVASLGGLRNKVLSAKYFATGRPVKFVQDDLRVRLLDLPAAPPDSPATTFALTLDGEPRQDLNYVRIERKREGV